MSKQLVLADPLTTLSIPPWLSRLEEAKTGERSGTMTLRVGAGLTQMQRDHLRRVAGGLRSSLFPKADDRQTIGAELLGLFAAFPAQQLSEATARARTSQYLDMAAQYPAWAVHKAIRFWMNEEHGLPTDHYAFPPSPPQLSRLIKLAMKPVYEQVYRCDRMATAEEERAPPTPEQKARVDELLAQFRKPSDAA